MTARVWCGKHYRIELICGKNRKSNYSMHSYMNIHKDSSLVEDKRWSRKLDNCHKTPRQILLLFNFCSIL
jgi:hypothetical protein